MKTAIAVDTNSGIFEQEAAELGIYTIPMPVIIDGKTFYEGKDLEHGEFFDMLRNHRIVSTSQPSPGEVTAFWDGIFADGYDEIVHMPMSSGLSSACQTAAMLAAEEPYAGRVFVADNHRISVTQRHAVMDALAWRDMGLGGEEIRKRLVETAKQSVIYIGVETLEYLKRGGRVTPAGAAIGSFLHIKPLLIILGERLDAFAKVRGSKNCKKREAEALRQSADEVIKKGAALRFGAAGSFADPAGAEEWVAMLKEVLPDDEIRYDPLSLSVSCHVGADAFGAGFSVIPPELRRNKA